MAGSGATTGTHCHNERSTMNQNARTPPVSSATRRGVMRMGVSSDVNGERDWDVGDSVGADGRDGCCPAPWPRLVAMGT
jgi:hypothetical protein